MIIIGIVVQFIPYWCKVDPDNSFTYHLYQWILIEHNNVGEVINMIEFPYMGIGMFGIFDIFVSLYALVVADQLRLQKRICTKLMLVISTHTMFAYIFGYRFSQEWLYDIEGQYLIGFYLLLIQALLCIGAVLFIMNDIKTVASSKRIR